MTEPKFKIGDYAILSSVPSGGHPCKHLYKGLIVLIKGVVENNQDKNWVSHSPDEICYWLEWYDRQPDYLAMPCGINFRENPQAPESWLQPFDIESYEAKKEYVKRDVMQEYAKYV